MRDPGTARSNPLLGHETVEDPIDDSAPDRSVAGDAAADEFGTRAEAGRDAGWKDPTSQPFPDDDWATLEDLLAPGSAGEAVVTALMEAGPEALEHLTAAGHELLLAAKTMIDAAERGLAEYRRLADDEGDLGNGSDPEDPPTNVTHLDPR